MSKKLWQRIRGFVRSNWKIIGVLLILIAFILVAQRIGLDKKVTILVVLLFGYMTQLLTMLAALIATVPVIGPPIASIIAMMIILMILGTFMEQVAMMMITIPIFLPLIYSLKFDPIWFSILMLLNLEMAMSTPPFGILLFVMKGSAPPGTTLGDIAKAAIPFLTCDLIVLIILIAYPPLVLFLPGLM